MNCSALRFIAIYTNGSWEQPEACPEACVAVEPNLYQLQGWFYADDPGLSVESHKQKKTICVVMHTIL